MPWSVVFLGVIALATIIMATIQIGAILYAGRLARRVESLLDRLEREVKPLIGRLNTVTADAARVSAIAAGQAERLDRLLTDLTTRVEQTAAQVQEAIVRPARQSIALLRGIQAGLAALLAPRAGALPEPAHVVEEEDALFIG